MKNSLAGFLQFTTMFPAPGRYFPWYVEATWVHSFVLQRTRLQLDLLRTTVLKHFQRMGCLRVIQRRLNRLEYPLRQPECFQSPTVLFLPPSNFNTGKHSLHEFEKTLICSVN